MAGRGVGGEGSGGRWRYTLTVTPSAAIERLIPVLVRIQARLDDDLSLAALATEAGLSPHYFHRLFQRTIGETPKRYCERLRLERAAFRLSLHRSSILDIAFDCGYQSHESFTRAFRRRFGTTPRQYRSVRRYQPPSTEGAVVAELRGDCQVSQTQVRELEDLPVAFLRHVGPYEDVPEDLWHRLTAWAEEAGLVTADGDGLLLLGIAHDAPGLTPPDRMRFDAALRVPEPFPPTGDIGFQVVPGGPYGVTTHVGPYATLDQAYRAGFARLSKLRRYQVVGLPAVEIYQATRINASYALNQTEIYLPLEPR